MADCGTIQAPRTRWSYSVNLESNAQLYYLLNTSVQTTKEEDCTLAQRYLLGDQAAGERLYRAAFPKVWKFVCSSVLYGPLEQETDDITSDAFVIAYRNIAKLNEATAFSTFVNGIAKRLIQNRRKKMKADMSRRSSLYDELGEFIDIEDAAPSWAPHFSLEEQESREYAARMIPLVMEQLTPKQKQAVQLRAFHDHSFREIGEHMGSNEDAAEQAYRAGIRKLRKTLEQAGYEGNGYWRDAA